MNVGVALHRETRVSTVMTTVSAAGSRRAGEVEEEAEAPAITYAQCGAARRVPSPL